jgi:hypothetical protein
MNDATNNNRIHCQGVLCSPFSASGQVIGEEWFWIRGVGGRERPDTSGGVFSVVSARSEVSNPRKDWESRS